MKIKKHIEIVRASTANRSSMGKKSCNMIKSFLEQRYEYVGITTIDTIEDAEGLVMKQPDLAFLGLKQLPSAQNTSPAWMSTYLDANGINYTGSTGAAIALDYNKSAAKHVVMATGLKTSNYFLARAGQHKTAADLPFGFPLFIKPPHTGGGKGIGPDSVARNMDEFSQKVHTIERDYNTHALVEQYLSGREFSVAVIDNKNTFEPLAMPIELITEPNERGDSILGQRIKAADTEHVVEIIDVKLKQAVVRLALQVYKALGARDYGRIDIRLDSGGVPHFLEANLIPGLAQHSFTSYFTSACWINQTMDYEAMILHIVELGLVRTTAYHNFSTRLNALPQHVY